MRLIIAKESEKWNWWREHQFSGHAFLRKFPTSQKKFLLFFCCSELEKQLKLFSVADVFLSFYTYPHLLQSLFKNQLSPVSTVNLVQIERTFPSNFWNWIQRFSKFSDGLCQDMIGVVRTLIDNQKKTKFLRVFTCILPRRFSFCIFYLLSYKIESKTPMKPVN